MFINHHLFNKWEKKGPSITKETLQLFLTGTPDSALKNFFRRRFLQKTNGIATSNLGVNVPTPLATTTTTACYMHTSTSNTMSSNSRGRGASHTRTNRRNWFRGYRRGNFNFYRGHPYQRVHRARGPRHLTAFHCQDNKQENTNFNSLDNLKETL